MHHENTQLWIRVCQLDKEAEWREHELIELGAEAEQSKVHFRKEKQRAEDFLYELKRLCLGPRMRVRVGEGIGM